MIIGIIPYETKPIRPKMAEDVYIPYETPWFQGISSKATGDW